jgi:sulfatase maturation enzyme AslB (radical SAM superfamily)
MHSASTPKKYLWVWIDPTMSCNLSCKLCYTKDIHAQNHMSVDTFKKIIAELSAKHIVIQKLHLNWNGEPTMNPNLLDFIEILESNPVYFPWEFHTNGMLINEDYALRLLKVLKTGAVFVSIDGGNASSHNFNRGEGTFEKSIIGLRNLLNAKNSLGYGTKIGVFQLDLGVQEDQYSKEFVELAEASSEWVRVQPFHPKNGAQFTVNVNKLNNYIPDESAKSTVDPSNRWWLQQIPDVSYLPSNPCFWAGNSLFFHTNGDARICLFSRQIDGYLGNILVDDIDMIIGKGEEFRKQIGLNGRQNFSHCKGCKFLEGEPRIEVLNNL